MALKKCKECNEEISSSAKTCPKCGKKQTMGCFGKILVAFGILVILGVIGNMLGEEQSPPGGQAVKPTPVKKIYLEETCAQVAKKFSLYGKMTDLQKKETWKQYDRKWVIWSGKVAHVAETWGQLSVQVKCLSSSISSDAIISFDDSARSQLIQLQEGQKIKFEGQLDDYNQFMGLSIDHGALKQ